MPPPPTPPNNNNSANRHDTNDESADQLGALQPNRSNSNIFPPPKTDKPRPHVCGTCHRSFARLEHLKRHERSHTKEKPFQCPECTRCFARRDLLLRHQQKLHTGTAPTSRPRNRRESICNAAAARVRKPSTSAAPARPRANTIGHVDVSSLNLAASSPVGNGNVAQGGQSRHGSLMGLRAHDSFDFGANLHNGSGASSMGEPLRLETDGLNRLDMSGGLRTAPVDPAIMTDFDWDMFNRESSTVNPNVLHYNDSPHSMALDSASSYVFPNLSGGPTDDNYDWMSGYDHNLDQVDFTTNDHPVDGSSPSAMSTTSQSGISDGVMLDGSNCDMSSGSMWQHNIMAPSQLIAPNPFSFDVPLSTFPDYFSGTPISPHTQKQPADPYYTTPPPSMSSLSPSLMSGLAANNFQPPMGFGPETPPSLSGANNYSPVSTITEATRQALIIALNQMTPFGGRRNSYVAFNPSLPSQFNNAQPNDNALNLPSTADLQRYVGAYIQYFQTHLPFLHLPTLSFDVSPSQIASASHSEIIGGRGCLMLSMAAIGALYEMDHAISLEIFELAKKMIQLYLEERRKVDAHRAELRKAGILDPALDGTTHTPVWLAQVMLLNVIYGHTCGDKTAGEIAATHCAALVSLARGAGLMQRPSGTLAEELDTDDALMADGRLNGSGLEMTEEHREWIGWRIREERKRTLYSVFAASTFLMLASNQNPTIMNSEIQLDLPCEEDLWACDSAASFNAKGGVRAASQNTVSFLDALADLLHAGERRQQMSNGFGHEQPWTALRPSSFGCYMLINALHNYIWESRQHHFSKSRENDETEGMHRLIEPALKAWQEAWASNPDHNIERPNPYGFGALSADSIPLLDLAYVRLFVNFGRSKERLWQRDFDGMADELARGSDAAQASGPSPLSVTETNSDQSEGSSAHDSPATSDSSTELAKSMSGLGTSSQVGGTPVPSSSSSSKRERHLRRAALYAADSLSVSDKLGVTFADCTSRELPLQSSLCLCDCAQVLAEWVTVLQERVGPYLGVLGRDEVDYAQVPGIMLLEEEDMKLLVKIQGILHSAEVKMNYQAGLVGVGGLALQQRSLGEEVGFAAKMLHVSAYMLDKSAVWPVTRIMAHALETQAGHMRARAEVSVAQRM